MLQTPLSTPQATGSVPLVRPISVPQHSPLDEITQGLTVLTAPNQPFECRIIGSAVGPASRVFTVVSDAAAWIAQFDHRCDVSGCYVTLNPLKDGIRGPAKDVDIDRRYWLLVDLDPERASNTNSSNAELDAARELAGIVGKWLGEKGWPAPVAALSGNGIHLYYPLAADVETKSVKGVLEVLRAEFAPKAADAIKVKVDVTVHNPSRITKIPGTLTRKGPAEPDRPQRRAKLLQIPTRDRELTNADLSAILSASPDAPRPVAVKKSLSLPQLEPIRQECAFVKHCFEDRTTLAEPEWFAALSIVGRCEGGEERAQEMSRDHPGYDPAKTTKKLQHALDGAGPRRCQSIEAEFGFGGCASCQHRGGISSPIQLGHVPAVAGQTVEVEGKQRILLSHDDPTTSAKLALETAGLRHTIFTDDEFFRFNGRCYEPLSQAALDARIQQFLEEAAELEGRGQSERARPFRIRTRDVDEVREAIKRVEFLESGPVPRWIRGEEEELDPAGLVAGSDGIVDIRTGKLLKASPDLFSTSYLDIPLGGLETAECARWLKFLDESFGGDKESIMLLQEVFGATLAGDFRRQKILLIIGESRSGKSTIGKVLEAVVGTGRSAAPSLTQFANTFGLEQLLGKRLALFPDMRQGATNYAIVLERLLQISSGDPISIDRKNKTPVQTKLEVQLVMITNEMPSLPDESQAILNRFHILETLGTRKGSEDIYLLDALMAELPGIIRWSVGGYQRLAGSAAFTSPAASKLAHERLRLQSAPASVFAEDRLEADPDGFTPTAILRSLYEIWALDNDVQGKLRDHQLLQGITQAFPRVRQTSQAVAGRKIRGLAGVDVKPAAPTLTLASSQTGHLIQGGLQVQPAA